VLHLSPDWAHPWHICAGTGPTPFHICTGTGLIRICTGTGPTLFHICTGTGCGLQTADGSLAVRVGAGYEDLLGYLQREASGTGRKCAA